MNDELTWDDPRITFLADQVRAILRTRKGTVVGPAFAATYIAMCSNREATRMGLTGTQFLQQYGIAEDIAQGFSESLASTPPEVLANVDLTE